MAVKEIHALKALLQDEDAVRFAYLFGSHARGEAGPLSDIDVAVYLAQDVDTFQLRPRLLERINRVLHSDLVDLVVLNESPPLLRHRVIRDGLILKEDEACRVEFEVKVLNAYLDTAHLRKIYQQAVKRRFAEGERRGG